MLSKEEIQTPTTWNGGITSCTVPPFSEKYMLSLVTILNSQGVNNYGNAIATTLRKDIGATFAKLSADVLQFSEEGTNLLIKNQWFEEPPHVFRNV
ncbi:MAG: DUF3231 family protein [Bacillaceae bacterium]|nr:DUF3231 family protein [Bacillaceae bacterium]